MHTIDEYPQDGAVNAVMGLAPGNVMGMLLASSEWGKTHQYHDGLI